MMVEFGRREKPPVPATSPEAASAVSESEAGNKQKKMEELRALNDAELDTWLNYWEELYGTMGKADQIRVNHVIAGINDSLKRLNKSPVTQEELPKGTE